MTFERLTMRNSDGTVSQPTGTTVESVFYRLAEYEDTDLRPEDIVEYKKFEDWLVQNNTTIAHVIELLQAEKDGLVTVQKRFTEGCCGGCHHFLREKGSARPASQRSSRPVRGSVLCRFAQNRRSSTSSA